MSKIYMIKTPNNAVNFANTRQVIMNNAMMFADGTKDFGIGAEAYTECPGCDRNLPLVIFHLDHIKSRARYSQTNLGLLGNDDFVIIDAAASRSGDARATATGGAVTIQTGSVYNPRVGIVHAVNVWENDLRNLQFLCPHCNTSKGAWDWETWGQGGLASQTAVKNMEEFRRDGSLTRTGSVSRKTVNRKKEEHILHFFYWK